MVSHKEKFTFLHILPFRVLFYVYRRACLFYIVRVSSLALYLVHEVGCGRALRRLDWRCYELHLRGI